MRATFNGNDTERRYPRTMGEAFKDADYGRAITPPERRGYSQRLAIVLAVVLILLLVGSR